MARIVIVQYKRVKELTDSLEGETSRGCALSGAAFLDEELRETLQTYFVKSSTVNSLLERANLKVKSELAFALGLLSPEEFRGLEYIRLIRNRFAHHSRVRDFTSDETVSKYCREIHTLKLVPEPSYDHRIVFMNAVGYLFFTIRDEQNPNKAPEAKPDNFPSFNQRYHWRLHRSRPSSAD
jgi:DNA-binding MltR family transcriptional regulator